MFDVFLTRAVPVSRCSLTGGRGRKCPAAWVALGVLTGLGVLTKSALGLFPLIVVCTARAVVWTRRTRAQRTARGWHRCAAVAVIAAVVRLPARHASGGVPVANTSRGCCWSGVGTATRGAPPGRQPLGYVDELAKSYWPWLPLAVFGLWSTVREAFARGPTSARRRE